MVSKDTVVWRHRGVLRRHRTLRDTETKEHRGLALGIVMDCLNREQCVA